MRDEAVTLNGKAVHIVFRSEDTFYTVMKFKINDEFEKIITVTGIMPSVEKEVLYDITGHYTEHPKYGMQFQMETYQRSLPEEKSGIVRYLSGPLFPGIGKKTAEKIAESLGSDCLKKIREDYHCLETVEGMKPEKIRIIYEGMQSEDNGLEELVRFLNIHGIGIRNLIRINRAYGRQALDKIRENPYRVIEECDGFGFATADKIAMHLGFAEDDERRLYAFMVSLVMDLCMAKGDSYVTADELFEAFRRKTKGIETDPDALLDQAVLRRSLHVEDDRIYALSQYEAEKYTAHFLANFPYKELDPFDEDLLERYLESFSASIHIEYDEIQKQTIRSVMDHPFSIITGGPGTGKTTIIRALTEMFRRLYPASNVICAAPTGRAAKRMSEMTETDASTVHSILQWDLETNTFGKDENNPLEADILIVDEFSMVDIWLFYNLLKASVNVRKIILIGDENQLPSVGPGCVLRDLMASSLFPVSRLETIYRQKEGSDVIALAHDILHSETDLDKYQNEVAFLECDYKDLRNRIVFIVQNALDKGYDIDDIQVLSPMYSGNAGIDILNNTLQAAFNPPDPFKKEIRIGYTRFREGDKILQLKNQPDDDVYNGDIGILAEILEADETDTGKKTLVVDFNGIIVEYTQETWNHITLAYCISVHKSQGSEYPIVVMPFTSQHMVMLQRKLIYTAVTRARKALVMIGDKQAFLKGIGTMERHVRNTTLRQRLGKMMQSPDPFADLTDYE